MSAGALAGSASKLRVALVDEALAREAVGCVRLLFERSVQTHDFGESGAAHVVVMRPGSTPRDIGFEDAILYEESFGDVPRWDADYAWFDEALAASVAWFLRALAKREVAARGKAPVV